MIGAVIALFAALVVQIRTAVEGRVQGKRTVQRDALADLIATAEMVADDVRELHTASKAADVDRRDAVWPRYLGHWSDFVGAIARVRMHGPAELREQAWAFHNGWTAGLCDLADGIKRDEAVSDKAWNDAYAAAVAERAEFAQRAIELTDPPPRWRPTRR